MIKKISAIVLALVLCLSVIVVPASALDLGDKGVAFELKWDKDAYSAGETATLSIFMKVSEDYEVGTGSLLIGLNSAVIKQADNAAADIKDSMVASDLWTSFWKAPSNNAAWLASTVVPKVQAANTSEENALYDQYFKITISRDLNGYHENAANNKNGLPGADFNALADAGEPILQLSFVVASDVADGTAVNAGITSGSSVCSPVQTAFKYYTAPGTGTGTANIPGASFGTAVAEATVGTAGLGVSYWKDQIRFQADNAGAYAGKFDYRMLATIDGFADIFDDVADAKDTSDNDGILEAGFIFSKSGTVNKDTAIAQINGGAATYSAVTNAYVSTSFGGKEYVMACYVGGIADADVDTALSALGYVKYMVDGETKVATFDAAQTSTFRKLYDKNASNKPA